MSPVRMAPFPNLADLAAALSGRFHPTVTGFDGSLKSTTEVPAISHETTTQLRPGIMLTV